MIYNNNTQWDKSVRLLILFVTTLCSIAPSVAYLTFNLDKHKTRVTARGEVLAHLITDQINNNPDYWQFETSRFSFILHHNTEGDGGNEQRQLIDNKGDLVLVRGEVPKKPLITINLKVYDAGKDVGVLRINSSIRGIIVNSVLVLFAGCVFGVLLFSVLYFYPLKLMKIALKKLHKAREQAIITLDSIADGVITLDVEYNILSMNSIAEKFCKIPSKHAIGQPLLKCITLADEKDRAGIESVLEGCLDGGKGSVKIFEKLLLNSTDEENLHHLKMTVSPLFDLNSRLIGLVIALHDVTITRNLETRLNNRVRELDYIVDYAGVGIAFVRNGVVQSANTIVAEIIGLPREQIVGSDVGHILKSGLGYTDPIEVIYEHLSTVGIFDVEHFFTRVDGKHVWIRLIGRSIEPDKLRESGSVWIIQDITRLKIQVEQIEKARDTAEEVSQLKSDFLAHVSHELRSPLTGIIGANKHVLETDLSQHQSRYLKIIDDSAESLLQLINDLLDLTKIESGVMEMEVSPFTLHDVFRYVENIASIKSNEKALELTFDSDDNVPVEIVGDQLRLGQVLLNLVSNAVKFTDVGGVNISCYLEKATKDKVLLRFEVADTGCGIDEAARRKIFEAFVQASSSVSRTHGGSGLGLSICKKLTELMNGEIWVESEPGVGTTFIFTAWFEIDLDCSRKLPENFDDSVKQPKPSPVTNKRILVVEDHFINQTLMKLLLENSNHHVTIASNGNEALELLKRSSYDLVFMDIQLPIMDGLKTTQIIRRFERRRRLKKEEFIKPGESLSNELLNDRLPIVGMTGNASEEARQECFDAGMDGYISKPFEMKEISQTLILIFGHE